MKSIYNLLLSCCFCCSLSKLCTHNRAGEITYKHVSGFTYEFTITTYTKVSGVSGDADRTRLGIAWGDGTFDSLDRISETFLDADIKQNKYIGIHTYSGPFTYIVGVQDPNRIDGIININNAVKHRILPGRYRQDFRSEYHRIQQFTTIIKSTNRIW
jgi:hypothetical protein